MKSTDTPAEQLRRAEERIDWVLSHPAMSDWLKSALQGARHRQPVDVINDLELLGMLLQSWSGALIEGAREPFGQDRPGAAAKH